MPVQAVGDIILISFDGVMLNQRLNSSFRYKVGSVVGGPTNNAFAAAIEAAIIAAGNLVPKFLACCPPSYLLNFIWVQTIAPVRVQKSIFSLSNVGTFGFDASTANVATVITRRGDLANKHNVGSLHVPNANLDTNASGGTISANQLTANNTLGTQMLQAITVGALGSIFPVLWNGGPTTNSTSITSTQSQLTTRVMRRRTVGVGK